MRAIIPYKLAGSGVELKYAIRSLYKHCAGVDDILVIGEPPDWYTGEFYIVQDAAKLKEVRIMQKVLQAPDEVFLYTNDDFFLLTPHDIKTFPEYYDKTCGEMAMRHGSPEYKRMYENCPPQWLNYDVHAPMLMESKIFGRNYLSMLLGSGVLPIKTMYKQGEQGPFSIRCVDSKIRGYHTRAELDFHISGRDFFSTHNSAINTDLLKLLNDLYPDASPVE